jgi:hypothetical protein
MWSTLTINELNDWFEEQNDARPKLVNNWLHARSSGSADAEKSAELELRGNFNMSHYDRSVAVATLHSANPSINPDDSDYIFIDFILDNLPHGLIGLLVAAFFAAALSSKAAELNALASTSVIDFYRPFRQRGMGVPPMFPIRKTGAGSHMAMTPSLFEKQPLYPLLPPRKRAPRGLSLIEAMIFLSVLSITAVGVGVALQSIAHVPRGTDIRLATQLRLVERLEQLKAYSYTSLTSAISNTTLNDTVTIDDVSAPRKVTVAYFDADGSGTTDTDMVQVTVAINGQTLVTRVVQP